MDVNLLTTLPPELFKNSPDLTNVNVLQNSIDCIPLEYDGITVEHDKGIPQCAPEKHSRKPSTTVIVIIVLASVGILVSVVVSIQRRRQGKIWAQTQDYIKLVSLHDSG